MFDIKYKTEKEQLAAVRQNGNALKYIYNPSEKVQLAAVKKDCFAIRYIPNPSERVQLAAVNVKRYGTYSIAYIQNPSEVVQLAVIEKDNSAIQYINNPAPSVIRYMIENCDDLNMIHLMRIDFDSLPDDLRLLLEVRF